MNVIRIEYDPTLIEEATFLAARNDPRRERELHQAIDSLYKIPDEELRQQSFRQTFRDFFLEFGLDQVVSRLIEECPNIRQRVGKCIVREAARRKHESAELFVQASTPETTPSHRTLVIQACSHSFLEVESFALRMRRELRHVADMLDERFAYRREDLAGLSPQQSLMRDRYRVLWDIYVEGRLSRDGYGDEATVGRLKDTLGRVYAGYDRHACEMAFDRAFGAHSLTSQQLLDWAGNPHALVDEMAESCRGMPQSPGQPCPLCGFATHDWFDFEGDTAGTVANTIKLEHAEWVQDHGACRQCAEMYTSVTA